MSGHAELYTETLTEVPRAFASLLENYSGVPRSSQIDHILTIRDKGYKQHPYPCLGRFRFLDLDLSCHPEYHTIILPTLKRSDESTGNSSPKYLDVGCCLGQDIRKMVVDGVPVARVFGADLNPSFIDIGYALFQDEEKLPRSHFLAPADLFDFSSTNKLSTNHDQSVTVLHISAVFHLFNLSKQIQITKRCLSLLDPDAILTLDDGSQLTKTGLIVGGQASNIHPGEYVRRGGSTRFRHNQSSWQQIWEDVIANSEWKSKVRSVRVKSQMNERYKGKQTSDTTEIKISDDSKATTVSNGPAKDGSDALPERPKVIGDETEGFRWMTWAVFIDFI